jgi:hypothetical protein
MIRSKGSGTRPDLGESAFVADAHDRLRDADITCRRTFAGRGLDGPTTVSESLPAGSPPNEHGCGRDQNDDSHRKRHCGC